MSDCYLQIEGWVLVLGGMVAGSLVVVGLDEVSLAKSTLLNALVAASDLGLWAQLGSRDELVVASLLTSGEDVRVCLEITAGSSDEVQLTAVPRRDRASLLSRSKSPKPTLLSFG